MSLSRSTWITGLVSGAVAVALLYWAFAPRPIEVEVASAATGAFELTVDEDARTRLRERYSVSAPLAGRLSRITLREGDTVMADAVVASLTPVLSPMLDDRSLREQSARVETAQAQIGLAAARVERARVSLDQARTDERRTEQLAQKGFIAQTKLDSDLLAVRAAQKELEAAEQQRHVAGHELDQARAALLMVRSGTDGVGAGSTGAVVSGRGANAGADARSVIRSFEVRAPIAGRVMRIHQTSEATVALGAPLLELGDTQGLEIVAELLTTEALRTEPGGLVRIERWGGNAPLQGRIRRIEPAAFTKVSALGVEEQRVNVLIDITSPHEQWRALGDGFRVSVRIVTLALPDALRVPVSAVFPLPDRSSMAVFAIEDGRARRVAVDVGARNGTDAWIRAGLKPGVTVIVYPPSAVSQDSRVRPRRV